MKQTAKCVEYHSNGKTWFMRRLYFKLQYPQNYNRWTVIDTLIIMRPMSSFLFGGSSWKWRALIKGKCAANCPRLSLVRVIDRAPVEDVAAENEAAFDVRPIDFVNVG